MNRGLGVFFCQRYAMLNEQLATVGWRRIRPGEAVPESEGEKTRYNRKWALDQELDMMVQLKITREVIDAKIASPVFPLQKATTGKCWIVTDMRNINRTVRHSPLQMPYLEEELPNLRDAILFGSFDIKKALTSYRRPKGRDQSCVLYVKASVTNFWVPRWDLLKPQCMFSPRWWTKC